MARRSSRARRSDSTDMKLEQLLGLIRPTSSQPGFKLPRPIKYGWALALTALVVLTTAVDLARPDNKATEKIRPLMDQILFYLLAPPSGGSGRTGEIPASPDSLDLPPRQPVPPAVFQPGPVPVREVPPAY